MPLNFKFPLLIETNNDNNKEAVNKEAEQEGTTKKRIQHQIKFEYDYSEDGPPKLVQQSNTFESQIVFDDVSLILPLNVNNNYKIFEPFSLLTVYYDGLENLFPNHNKTL